MEKRPKILVILGPTASGKSDLAVKLAQKFNGEVISADSRQVYKGMALGSGKITKKEMKGIKHYLLDVASPKRQFSVSQFQKKAKEAIEKILKKGKLPIVCGGSWFWIKVLIEDWQLPEVKPDFKLRKKLQKKSAKELFSLLKKIAPQRAKEIDKENKVRLIRSLEIALNLLEFPKIKKRKSFEVLKIGIDLPFEKLKKKILIRLKKRFKKGMVKEVKRLKESGLSWEKIESFGLEYRWVALYLQKKIDFKQMEEKLFKDILRFARKQINLFKKDKEVVWVKNWKEAEKIVEKWLSEKI
ncbi:tRNA (adenosine(37)-N6)-dimethylallyltransferase MiaA [bacterium]|nr:tRNA (adenosine(37)-N6)-dimethylallyltransferase MiaA [bacterium]